MEGVAPSRSREQAGHAHQIVGRRRKVGPKPDLGGSALPQFAEAADGLHPAEDLFDALAHSLADLEARVASGPPINPGPAARLIFRRDVRGNGELTNGVDEVPRIVALVGSERPWLKASAA